MTTSVSWHQKG